eukprot:3628273-Rhodomonas_salina.1
MDRKQCHLIETTRLCMLANHPFMAASLTFMAACAGLRDGSAASDLVACCASNSRPFEAYSATHNGEISAITLPSRVSAVRCPGLQPSLGGWDEAADAKSRDSRSAPLWPTRGLRDVRY